MRDEGVIKFHCQWKQAPPRNDPVFDELINVRNELHQRQWIGVYPDGIGYGNVSVRDPNGYFWITATQTGHLETISNEHLTCVTGYDLKRNRLECEGPLQASSESLTHAMIYENFEESGAVIHIHHQAYWKRLLNQVPTTRREVPYGTPEMAQEILRLKQEGELASKKILVMAGHEDGIIAFGRDLGEAKNGLIYFCK